MCNFFSGFELVFTAQAEMEGQKRTVSIKMYHHSFCEKCVRPFSDIPISGARMMLKADKPLFLFCSQKSQVKVICSESTEVVLEKILKSLADEHLGKKQMMFLVVVERLSKGTSIVAVRLNLRKEQTYFLMDVKSIYEKKPIETIGCYGFSWSINLSLYKRKDITDTNEALNVVGSNIEWPLLLLINWRYKYDEAKAWFLMLKLLL